MNLLGHKDNDPRVEGLVNFGIGMFHFLVSFVPPALGWLVKLLGFEANREHAGVELERAANSKCHKSIEAKMLLIALKYFFNDEEEAGFKILTELKTSLQYVCCLCNLVLNCISLVYFGSFSTSPVVSYLAAFIKRLRGQIQEALDDFKQAASEIKVGELATSMNHHIGYTYFLQGNLEKAEEYLETFLASTLAYWEG
jgi:tetratricopeptide (TPR) repeat protein